MKLFRSGAERSLTILAAAVLFRAFSASAGEPAADWRRTLRGPAYLHQLGLEPEALREDLVRVLARLTRAKRPAAAADDLAAEAAALRKQGVLPEALASDLLRPLQRGHAALCVARYLGLEGGVSGRTFGLSPRVAYHDLVFRRVMPAGGEHYRMSGADLIALLARVRRFEKARGGRS